MENWNGNLPPGTPQNVDLAAGAAQEGQADVLSVNAYDEGQEAETAGAEELPETPLQNARKLPQGARDKGHNSDEYEDSHDDSSSDSSESSSSDDSDELRSKLQASSDQTSELERQVASLQAALEGKNREIATVRRERTTLQAQLVQMEEQWEELGHGPPVTGKGAGSSQLAEQVGALTEENYALKQKLKAMVARMKEMRREAKGAQAKGAKPVDLAQQHRIKQLGDEKQALLDREVAIQKELAQLRKENSALHSAKDELASRVKQVELGEEEYSIRDNRMQERATVVKKARKRLRDEKHILVEKVKLFAGHRARVQTEAQRVRSARKKFQEDVAKWRSVHREEEILEDKRKHLSQKQEQMTIEVAKARRTKERIKAERAELGIATQELELLRQKYDKQQASISQQLEQMENQRETFQMKRSETHQLQHDAHMVDIEQQRLALRRLSLRRERTAISEAELALQRRRERQEYLLGEHNLNKLQYDRTPSARAGDRDLGMALALPITPTIAVRTRKRKEAARQTMSRVGGAGRSPRRRHSQPQHAVRNGRFVLDELI